MHHRRISMSMIALLFAASLGACVDDDAALGEATEPLTLSDATNSGFFAPVTPAVFRGADWRVQVTGVNASGYVAWDIQREAGLWGTPNPTVVALPLRARYVAAAQDAWGRTVIVAVTGSLLMRTQQTTPYARTFNNWVYVDTAVMEREPALAVNQDGRLELAYVSSTGRVKTMAQTAPGGAWGSAVDTGFATTGTPELVRDRQARLELFVPRPAVPCGFVNTRQRAANGAQGWFPATTVASACFTTLAVGYADDATEVFGRTAAGAIRHHTRDGSDLLFRTGPQSFGGNTAPPTLVAKDDGRLIAFTGFTSCPNGSRPGTYGCGDYYASQREAGGGWWAWQPYATAIAASAVAGVDSIINNTYVFAAIGSTQYQRFLFRY